MWHYIEFSQSVHFAYTNSNYNKNNHKSEKRYFRKEIYITCTFLKMHLEVFLDQKEEMF